MVMMDGGPCHLSPWLRWMEAHVICPHGYGGWRSMRSPLSLSCLHRVSFSSLGMLITLQDAHLHMHSLECEGYVSAMLEPF